MKISCWWSEKANSAIARVRALGRKMPLPVRIVLAAAFFVLGVLGLFLPVLQGGLFLFIAFWLLFPERSEQWWRKIRAWYARLGKKGRRAAPRGGSGDEGSQNPS